MSLFLGLDVGTTSLSAVALDVAEGSVVAACTSDNEAGIAGRTAQGQVRAELDLRRLRALSVRLLRDLARALPPDAPLGGLGVTGQMHGLALLAPDGTPLAPAITWQDARVLDEAGPGETYLAAFLREAGGEEAFARMGCRPAAGYLGPTLYWLRRQGRLPQPPARACFIPDAAVAWLTGRLPPSDATNGGSSGIMDVVARRWDGALLARLGLPEALLGPVAEAGDPAGTLTAEVAEATGLPAGLPVGVAMGDNQASFLGSVRAPRESALVNVGTGGQVSLLAQAYARLPEVDARYYPGGRYLLVGAGLYGGRALGYLRAFFRQVGDAFYGGHGDVELYDEMVRLATAVPPGSEGLRFTPLFTGTRSDPTLRASITGIGPSNLTPGHLTRALLEGLAEGFFALYRRMAGEVGERGVLVGSGNGLRRNRLLAQIVAERWRRPLHLAPYAEEAAVGAALAAAVGLGALSGWDEAAAVLQSGETIAPPGGEA